MKNLRQDGLLTSYFRKFDSLLNKMQLIELVLERSALSHFVGDQECSTLPCKVRYVYFDLSCFMKPTYTLAKLHDDIMNMAPTTSKQPSVMRGKPAFIPVTRSTAMLNPNNS